MSQFKAIPVGEANLDRLLQPFESIGNDWMLITAGNGIERDNWNTMTASWGSFGVYWGKKTVTCVIRPTRHTYRFVESASLVTFSFFDPSKKEILKICGSTSGSDTDKAAAAGITPVLLEEGAIGFTEARLNLVCRKLFAQDINPDYFIDTEIDKNYPNKDYHRMYICEILNVYQGDN